MDNSSQVWFYDVTEPGKTEQITELSDRIV